MVKKTTRAKKPFFEGNEWTFPLLSEAIKHCEEIAVEELGLDCYPNQIEIINSEQMLDAYSSNGLPIMYKNWRFGKDFISMGKAYTKGEMGLAYEIVINSSPCISLLMEENSMTMQTLVIAHAAFGHNHFFKNNELFREWTDADGILDYLKFAQNYVAKCEERYGYEAVEKTLDAAHALQAQGVDRYRRPSPLTMIEERDRQEKRENELQKQINDLWITLPANKEPQLKTKDSDYLYPNEENLLYFLEKKAPLLQPWQRELLRINRKLAQYFYPNRQTKVMNEGFASFTHYYIMNRLWEKGLLSDGSMMEFLASHTAVLYSPTYQQGGFNPYALGFDIFDDIKRICEKPTPEDEEWFPDLAGKDWLTEIKYAAKTFRDESFILQYLSPEIMRKRRMFLIEDNAKENFFSISKIHNSRGYKEIRSNLSKSYNISYQQPDIQVEKVNFKDDRTLHLKHTMVNQQRLDNSSLKALKLLQELWGYKLILTSVDSSTGEQASTTLIE